MKLRSQRYGWALVLVGIAFAGCATSSQKTVEESSSSAGGGGSGAGGSGAGDAQASSAMSSSSTGTPGSCSTKADCKALDDSCHVGNCLNGMCEKAAANDGSPCDDGQYCTENDACQGGACVGGSQKFCPSPDGCHVGACDEAKKACGSAAGNDGAACDDGDPCTYSGKCSGGSCSKGPSVDCSAFDGECSVGVCDPVLGCTAQAKNDNSPCNDMQGSPCTTGVCMNAVCTSVPTNEGGACDDGLFCNVEEKCAAGVCTGGKPNPCAPPGGCFIASCDEANDACSAAPGNDGSACDDFNTCTANTTCLNGACIGGVSANEGAMCDDGSACTSGTTCTAGVCGGGMGPTVYFADDFHDNAKGWMLDTEWQIGSAQVSMNGAHGADPGTDHTATADNGIAGVVIGGNESPVLHAPYWLTSPPFNTANAANKVIFGFYRWLNSDYDPFMHNMVEVYDGNQWVNLWTSGSAPGIEDSPPAGTGWTYEEYDVTAYKNAGMRVRIGYDITSGGVFTIGSWNVDDVLVASAGCP